MTATLREDFRLAMRRFPATVTIISAAHDGARHGMTATAVAAVSMEPPSLLVCINRLGRLYDMMAACPAYCINVLHTEHSGVSRVFAHAHNQERFAHGDWLENDQGIPYLRDAQVSIFCRKSLVVPYGTHAVCIGDVEDVKVRADISPLLYQNGDYGLCEPLDSRP